MPCICGDPYCPSCGPAQGNHYCPHCGRWTDEGGCEDPDKCINAEKEVIEAGYKQWLMEQIWQKEAIKQNVPDIMDIDQPKSWWDNLDNSTTVDLLLILAQYKEQ